MHISTYRNFVIRYLYDKMHVHLTDLVGLLVPTYMQIILQDLSSLFNQFGNIKLLFVTES